MSFHYSNAFTITPDGYQFLLHNYHDQSYILLLSILRNRGRSYEVPFFSFLFIIRQMSPTMPYNKNTLDPELAELLPDFCDVGLL